MGGAYWQGEGVERDLVEAAAWYLKAAEGGDTTAMVWLGTAFLDGTGVAPDHATARDWYRRAADAGDADGHFSLFVGYDAGRFGSPEPAEAARHLLEAARADSEFANVLLADGLRTVSVGTRKELQRILKDAGHYSGSIDGSVGPGTRAAVDAYLGR